MFVQISIDNGKFNFISIFLTVVDLLVWCCYFRVWLVVLVETLVQSRRSTKLQDKGDFYISIFALLEFRI